MTIAPLDQGSITIARGGAPRAAVLLPPDASPFTAWMAGEVRHYVETISGASLPYVESLGEALPGMAVITLGGPNANPVAKAAVDARLADFRSLPRDGYLIRTLRLDDRSLILAGGSDEAACMYAAYDLGELLGVSFTLTADIVPERKPTLEIGPLHLRREPVVARRGLHMRHFVMPWMGLAEFQQMVGQMAKLRMNYLEFFAYVGSPWVEYAWRGEPKLIGDIYAPTSGFTAWRTEVYEFTAQDVLVGSDHFAVADDGEPYRPCAEEFRRVRTQDEAYAVARELLREMIGAAHARRIELWLGKGDCPYVPPNLGRHSRQGQWSPLFGRLLSPGDPAAVEIWIAAMRSLVDTYPHADGFWLWLSEGYLPDEEATRAIAERYRELRSLIPGLQALREMGYDQYLRDIDEDRVVVGDLGLVHCAKEVVGALRAAHPKARLGVSVLGRSYLFRALDAALPPGVALQSMESAVCWNRGSRVPMENLAVTERDTFLVPRLDDDESELAMQFNAGLYHRDCVVSGSQQHGLNGIAAQMGRTRGVELNARYLAEGMWDAHITPSGFHRRHAAATYGLGAAQRVADALGLLDDIEGFLGIEVDAEQAGPCFQGIGNFVNYADSRDIRLLATFRGRKPHEAPPFGGTDSALLPQLRYRDQRYRDALEMLGRALEALRAARSDAAPGARLELDYLAMKTEVYTLHLRALRELMAGHFAYGAAFRADGEDDALWSRPPLSEVLARYEEAYRLETKSATVLASAVDHPADRHILFRQNVRFLLPLREFVAHVRNVVAFHRGEPYWQPVRWELVAPELPASR